MGNASQEEIIHFNYWLVIVQLLKLGIPYNVIITLAEGDLALLIATTSALDQRDAERDARMKRMSQG